MNNQSSKKIARVWHGVVPEEKSDEYYRYLRRTGLSDYRSVKGNRGVFVFRQNENGRTHFLLLTLWDSCDSIRTFAGDDIHRARYYPEDADYLLELEPHVKHYEVLLDDRQNLSRKIL